MTEMSQNFTKKRALRRTPAVPASTTTTPSLAPTTGSRTVPGVVPVQAVPTPVPAPATAQDNRKRGRVEETEDRQRKKTKKDNDTSTPTPTPGPSQALHYMVALDRAKASAAAGRLLRGGAAAAPTAATGGEQGGCQGRQPWQHLCLPGATPQQQQQGGY